jgi:malonyl-CoA O-methyltransferase
LTKPTAGGLCTIYGEAGVSTDTSERVSEHFRKLAGVYGEGEYFTHRRQAVLQQIASEIAIARCILDLGCGPGQYLSEFAKLAPQALCVGSDLAPEMLIEARKRATACLVRADTSQLPCREKTFDVVFASHIFPFVSDMTEAVRGAVRCLRNDGLLIATVEVGGIGREIVPIIGKETMASAPAFHVRAFLANERLRRQRKAEPRGV